MTFDPHGCARCGAKKGRGRKSDLCKRCDDALEAEYAHDHPGSVSVTLKACPFCGSLDLDVASTNAQAHWISCENCFAQASAGDTLAEGARNWNRRPKIPTVTLTVQPSVTAAWDIVARRFD